jgi:type IX secretion system PorP/SprF family membrane protein
MTRNKKTSVMKTVKKLSLSVSVCMLLLISFNGKAQYDAMFTQYMFNEMFINPAYAGSKEAMAVTALHRQQWVSFPGRPVTTTFSLHGPLQDNKMGLGLSVLNEQVGVLNRNLVYLSYAYRMKAGKEGKLSFGLNAGIHNQVNKFSQIKTTDEGDIQFTNNTPNVITPNFGFGTYYYTKRLYAGLSIPRLVDDHVLFTSTGDVLKTTKISPSKFHYYLAVGYLFDISESLKLKPQFMLKAVQNAPANFDINVNALIKDMVWVGVAYRSSSDIAGLVGIQLGPQFTFSYSYDFPLSKIQTYTQGSHEIALGYLFTYKGKKLVTPRYF